MPKETELKPASGATPLIAIAAVAVDTETTGPDATKARVVQIGAIGIAHGKVVRQSQLDLLIDPGEAIPSAASLVHGITDADVDGAGELRGCMGAIPGVRRGPHPRRPLDRLRPGGIGARMPTRPFALEQASGAVRPASCKPSKSQSGRPFAGNDRRLASPGDRRPPFRSGRCDRGRRHLCRVDSGVAQAQHPNTRRGRGRLPWAFGRSRSRPSRRLGRAGVATPGSRVSAG